MFQNSYNPGLALDAADGVLDGKFFGSQIYNTTSNAFTVPSAQAAIVSSGTYNPGFALDAADGVLDGKFFGAQIYNSSSNAFTLPTSTPAVAFGGTVGGVNAAWAAPTWGSTAFGNRALALDAADGVIDGKFFGAKIVDSAPVYKTGTYAGYAGSSVGLGLSAAVGGFIGGTSYPFIGGAAQLQMPSYPTFSGTAYPTYAPTYPTMSATFSSIMPAANSFVSSMQFAPSFQYQNLPAVQYIQAPPQMQLIEAPPMVLQLPAPLPPAPAPLPPPPQIIHIKDDNGPKIASLQAEIQRLERLLGTAKETEASLRNEIQELYVKIEVYSRNQMQTATLESEVARLKEQLLEAQRRIVFLEGQRDEAHKHIAFLESQLKAADAQIAQMTARIRQLELEITNLRARLEVKQELHSRTSVHETYKVKTFEMAAKLAVMDGTDDGMYNGLPIEVEGQGLYRDLVASGRRVRENVSLTGRPTSSAVTTTSETYKVQTFEMAEKLAKMGGHDDGRYNGLPIEVTGEGLYMDLVRSGRRSTTTTSSAVVGGAGSSRTSVSGGQTYKVATMEMAAKISKLGGSDDGTYKGLPIEVQGMGIYSQLR